MNKVLLFVGAGVLVSIGVLFFVFRGTAPATPNTTGQGVATATTLKKTLSVTPAGATQSREIADTATVSQGDTVSTSHDGRGLIAMSNGSTAVLDYDSSMVLQGVDSSATHASLVLVTGRVWAQVQKVLGLGEYFEIKTNNAVAVVRGTSFGLARKSDGSTELLVHRGTVALTPLNPSTGEMETDKTISVTAGNKGIVTGDGSTTQSALTPDDMSSDWFVSNTEDSSGSTNSNNQHTDTSSAQQPPATADTTHTTTGTPQSGTPSAGASGSTSAGSDQGGCASVTESGSTGSGIGTLRLAKVSPSSVSQASGTTVTLTGSGFECVLSIGVGDKTLVQSDTGEIDYQIVNDTTITLSSSVLPIGSFDMSMDDTLGNHITLPKAITVTQ